MSATTADGNSEKPLSGLRVIDLSRVIAGPYCGQVFADMGADVVKVETPDGDENRRWPPLDEDGSSNFECVNRGKLGLTIDLKAKAGQQVLDRLLRSADILIHNYLPETATKLGIEEGGLRERFPRLIVCTITGYGRHGPLANKPGYDTFLQAFSGAMSTTGYPDLPPVRVGLSFIDISTGLSAYAAVMTALHARSRTGRGDHVHTSLLENAVSLLAYHAVEWFKSGALPERKGSVVGAIVPYQVFTCLDGYILAAATSDAAWGRLCKAMRLDELIEDERFRTAPLRVTNAPSLNAILEQRFQSDTVAHWVEKLEAGHLPVSPINTLDKVLTHPQVLANDLVVEAASHGKSVKLVGMPFKVGDDGTAAPTAAPRLGEHTQTILRDLGYSEAEISELSDARVI